MKSYMNNFIQWNKYVHAISNASEIVKLRDALKNTNLENTLYHNGIDPSFHTVVLHPIGTDACVDGKDGNKY